MIVVYSLLSPHFLTVSNFTNVLVQCSPLLILAAGQTFPILMGGLDLSQGSIVSLVSVVTAGVMLDHGLGLATSLELDRACLSDGRTGFCSAGFGFSRSLSPSVCSI